MLTILPINLFGECLLRTRSAFALRMNRWYAPLEMLSPLAGRVSGLCLCCNDCVFSYGYRSRTDAETTVHALRDCRSANAIWSFLLPHACRVDFFRTNLQDWLCSNLAADFSHPSWDLNWSILFASTLWQIWCMRNNWVFNDVQVSQESILHKSISWARYYSESCVFNERVQSDTGLTSPIHWQRPEEGFDVNALVLADAMAKFDSANGLSLFAVPPSPLQPFLDSAVSTLMY
ncbi:hypothetical protein V6N12_013212 [Hibiscus sabdariffa]|uniref:Reverse transcriptase zinc-binding domain-containing protein n=1 Tax=Hibiscus sabdariffa TaxID=183260 RepID=A0ABR2D7K1_9ROSI